MGKHTDAILSLRPRLRAAERVLHQAVAARVRMSLGKPFPLKSVDGQDLGYLDIVRLQAGQFRVAGWTRTGRITLATECQSLDLPVTLPRADLTAIDGAYGFDCTISGGERLSVAIEGSLPPRLVLQRKRRHGIAAWTRTAFSLGLLPIRQANDLVAWFLHGDSAAGSRLEQALVPQIARPAQPRARAGLFAAGDQTPADPEPVDIVIPVHNAYEDLSDCLARVGRFTPSLHRVILIDDASTDDRIGGLLADFVKSRPNSALLTNERNLGFVASVNLGLEKCKRHAVLLNTDAMVGAGWIERLLAPILAVPGIASVTPMTNNGEIASAPVICRSSDLEKGATDRINLAAQRLHPVEAIVDVPTGVGFCMALSRHWLDKVPRLDPVFGRGYGEEVDWCRKVAAIGGRHVLSGALFVEHRGGRSFGPEKASRIAQNNRILSRRYPDYDKEVQDFIRRDPAVGLRLALGIAMAGGPSRTVPVYLAHHLGGGSEQWLGDEISRHLAEGEMPVILRDGDVPSAILVELHGPLGITLGQVPFAEIGHYLAGASRRRLVYSNLVGSQAPLSILSGAVAALRPSDDFQVLFHDFFPLCPSYNLIGADGQFCELPEEKACQLCYVSLAQTSGQRPAFISQWRQAWHEVLARATEIVVFSADSRKRVARVWPDFADRILVHPHVPRHLPNRVATLSGASERLVIGVLGAIGYNKGAKVLQDLADSMSARTDLVIVGKVAPAWRHHRMTIHGRYDRSEIADLAARYGISVWLIPSIWPETFCFTVHEALATGLPVFVFDLGAQAEAAAAHENGHLLPIGCKGLEIERQVRTVLQAGTGRSGDATATRARFA